MVVLAESYLQQLERSAIQQALQNNVAPITYRRYVDDSRCRFRNIEEAKNFNNILNEQDPKIQYTIETETEPRKLNLLDVTVIDDKSGRYSFKIRRKDAITNVILKPNSSINPNVHVGVLKGFIVRALRLCSNTFLKEELEFIIEIFVENGHDRTVGRSSGSLHSTSRSWKTV